MSTSSRAQQVATGDSLSDDLVPEVILPLQYFARLAPHATDIPEKRLMFAVLLDAVIHLQRRDSRGATEVAQWIREEDEESVFSFSNICEALGIEPVFLARGLLAWYNGTAATPMGVPARQLRTAHRRITPPRQRRRRRAAAV
jgi:hypothetical protein